jgi:hypothetical protein
MNWKAAADEPKEYTTEDGQTLPAPEPNWDHTAEASAKTLYCIHDQGEGRFNAVVRVKQGKGTLNLMISESASLEEAKAACESDWNSGKRP